MLRNTFIISVSRRLNGTMYRALVISSGLQWNLFKWPDQISFPENAHRDRSSQAGFHVRLGFQHVKILPPPEAWPWKISSHVGSNATEVLKSKYEAHHKVPPNKISTVDVNELHFSQCSTSLWRWNKNERLPILQCSFFSGVALTKQDPFVLWHSWKIHCSGTSYTGKGWNRLLLILYLWFYLFF